MIGIVLSFTETMTRVLKFALLKVTFSFLIQNMLTFAKVAKMERDGFRCFFLKKWFCANHFSRKLLQASCNRRKKPSSSFHLAENITESNADNRLEEKKYLANEAMHNDAGKKQKFN